MIVLEIKVCMYRASGGGGAHHVFLGGFLFVGMGLLSEMKMVARFVIVLVKSGHERKESRRRITWGNGSCGDH